MRPLRAPSIALALAVGLGGCATAPRPTPDDPAAVWQERQRQLRAIERWQARGRLSVKLADEGGQAHFTWRQRGPRLRLRLAGPWGQGGVLLESGPNGARLDAGEGRRYRGRDARRLLAAVYGWDIPVEGLRYWLLGLPRAQSSYELDRFGRVATLSWREWRIEYRRYERVGGLELPAVLRARRDDDTEIRLAIHQWRLDGERHGIIDPSRSGGAVPLIGG